ncbi:MAG TPA: dihydroorotate dehydrogenase electron transfer subunit [Candidatus Tumulicola sp.]|nr:dihydroorotate dehydrogenase electron transfer subunit [Candidatus Tumulicola sp.]
MLGKMPAIDFDSRVRVTRVVDRRELAAGVVLLGVHAPEVVRETRPGQYVMAIPPGGEAPATALGVYEAHDERASLMFFVTGRRTRELSELRPGDRLDLVGPLGNGFDLAAGCARATIVAGGVGIASVLLAAQTLVRSGARVELLYGARSADLLVDAQRFADEGCELVLATDDGSRGHRGYVTELLAQRLPCEAVLACGPTPMLRAVARIAASAGTAAQLSLEETFACGVGGCWGCVVPLRRSSAQAPSFPPASRGGSDVVYARICKEGPVFRSDELAW